jgi:hypothetical protein
MVMLNITRLIAVTVFVYILSAAASHAVVQLVDTEDSGFRLGIDIDITQGVVETGSGFPGDFVLLTCGTFSDGNNTFLDPVPDSWSTLDSGECGGNEQCIQGIFARFDESAESSEITCNWTDPTDAFAAGTFRYRGVDPVNPVIAVACNTGGFGDRVIFPSVVTEPLSTVILIITFGEDLITNPSVQPDQIFEGGFLALGQNTPGSGEFVMTQGQSFSFPEGGPTGDFDLGTSGFDFRACTVALRMASTNIPTLSEWGMLAAAAGLMIVGVFFAVRRKKMQDA